MSWPMFTARNDRPEPTLPAPPPPAFVIAERIAIEQRSLARAHAGRAQANGPFAIAFYDKHIARTEERIAELKASLNKETE